jgi:hypothetical protein
MAKRLLLTAAIAGLVAVLVAQSPPPPPSPSEGAEQKQDVSGIENPQSQPTYSPSPARVTTAHQQASPPTQSDATTKGDVRNDSPTVNRALLFDIINTVLLTIFTGILAVVAVYQYRLTHRQADSARITERAIVLIDSVEATRQGPAFGRDGASVVIITLKNFGRTIASAVELTGMLTGFGQLRLEKSPPTTIAPQGTNSWITKSLSGLGLNDSTITLINHSGLLLGYKISVTYTDAFGAYSCHCEGRYEPSVKKFLITASKTD